MTTDFSKLPQDIIKHINLFISDNLKLYILFTKYGIIYNYLKKYLKDKKTLSKIMFYLCDHFKISKGHKVPYAPSGMNNMYYMVQPHHRKNFTTTTHYLLYFKKLLIIIETIIKRKHNISIYTTKFMWESKYPGVLDKLIKPNSSILI